MKMYPGRCYFKELKGGKECLRLRRKEKTPRLLYSVENIQGVEESDLEYLE